MQTTMVKQHMRRIAPKTGRIKPVERVDESKPFFGAEPVVHKAPFWCRIGQHWHRPTHQHRTVMGRLYFEHVCRCGHTIWVEA